MKSHETSEYSPALVVKGEYDGGVVVAEVLAGEHERAVGEHDVVVGETFFGCGGGGDDEDWAGAEKEVKDMAVLLVELGEGLVDGRLEKVKVAEDGESQGLGEVDMEIPFGYEDESY